MTVALMAVPSFRLSGQSPTGTDPRVLGTWRLNVAKSKFRPGPPYREEIRIYEAHEQGVRSIIKRVLANGRQATIEYTANYDSVEYPVTGSSEYNAIRLKKVDDVTFEGVLSHADRVFAVTRRVISEDGRTMTITFQASEFQGTRVDNVMVYDKQ
jgi:histidinol dehydrogenase